MRPVHPHSCAPRPETSSSPAPEAWVTRPLPLQEFRAPVVGVCAGLGRQDRLAVPGSGPYPQHSPEARPPSRPGREGLYTVAMDTSTQKGWGCLLPGASRETPDHAPGDRVLLCCPGWNASV
ncbi:T0155578 isoform 4 [Pan troglodytes]|uniref:T0155578 isoform 4 n=1 Tax=Pan troglodytes TaxID=9598 RepID=A0A2J8JVX0_PANTR|nr:T0155578 isoform 4 [Pan troglodytes]